MERIIETCFSRDAFFERRIPWVRVGGSSIYIDMTCYSIL